MSILEPQKSGEGGGPRIVSLTEAAASRQAFAELARTFRGANPGYSLEHLACVTRLGPSPEARVLFVVGGAGGATVTRDGGRAGARLARGDALLLRPNDSLELDAALDLLQFGLPGALPPALPTFLQPDHDPLLCDRPGGCAEEERAYRRILLTWLASNGPYVLHELNAHRVRMHDSLSHYHPLEGGFDELYLVEAVDPGGRLYTSTRVPALLAPDELAPADLPGLIRTHDLHPGDLVYLPRGTMHRAVGGVLAQVITVPGFRPGAELGLDHALLALNQRFGLQDERALPYRAASAHTAIVR